MDAMEKGFLKSVAAKIQERYKIIEFRLAALENLINGDPLDGFDATDELLQVEYNNLQDEKEFIEGLGVLGVNGRGY